MLRLDYLHCIDRHTIPIPPTTPHLAFAPNVPQFTTCIRRTYQVRLNGVKCWAKMMKGQSHLQFPISLPQHVSLPNLDSAQLVIFNSTLPLRDEDGGCRFPSKTSKELISKGGEKLSFKISLFCYL